MRKYKHRNYQTKIEMLESFSSPIKKFPPVNESPRIMAQLMLHLCVLTLAQNHTRSVSVRTIGTLNSPNVSQFWKHLCSINLCIYAVMTQRFYNNVSLYIARFSYWDSEGNVELCYGIRDLWSKDRIVHVLQGTSDLIGLWNRSTFRLTIFQGHMETIFLSTEL